MKPTATSRTLKAGRARSRPTKNSRRKLVTAFAPLSRWPHDPPSMYEGIPHDGYCQCGCDEKTNPAPYTDASKGYRKGGPATGSGSESVRVSTDLLTACNALREIERWCPDSEWTHERCMQALVEMHGLATEALAAIAARQRECSGWGPEESAELYKELDVTRASLDEEHAMWRRLER